jgi:hypothetical protein
LWERIGRLKEKQHGIGQHYQIDLQTDDSGEKALLAAVKKRGKPADIDDGKRPSIMVNKKGAR